MKAAALDQHHRNPSMSSCSAFLTRNCHWSPQWRDHQRCSLYYRPLKSCWISMAHERGGRSAWWERRTAWWRSARHFPSMIYHGRCLQFKWAHVDFAYAHALSSRGFNVLVSHRVWKEIKRPTWFLTTETDWNCFSVIPVGLQNKTATLCLLFVPLNDLIHHRKKHTHNWQQSHFRISVGNLMLSSSNSLLLDWCFVLYILL